MFIYRKHGQLAAFLGNGILFKGIKRPHIVILPDFALPFGLLVFHRKVIYMQTIFTTAASGHVTRFQPFHWSRGPNILLNAKKSH